LPAIEISAIPEVAGMARSYVPAGTTRQERDFHINRHLRKRERIIKKFRNDGRFKTRNRDINNCRVPEDPQP